MNRFACAPLIVLMLLAAGYVSVRPSRVVASNHERAGTSVSSQDPMVERRRRVDVGGYKLYIDCIGTGTPAVILDGNFVETWEMVQPMVGGFTRACSFDRPGLGLSDAGSIPLTSAQIVRDVHNLLRNARIPGPYILVGHGFGGSTMRLYASRYPGQVAGLVLVDAFHQALFSHPEIVHDQTIDLAKSRAQLRSARSLGALPLIVLSHGIYLSFPSQVERVWPTYQRKLAQLSSNSAYVIAEHSGYLIPQLQPALVSETILEVMEAARSHSHRLEPCGLWIEARGGACAGR